MKSQRSLTIIILALFSLSQPLLAERTLPGDLYQCNQGIVTSSKTGKISSQKNAIRKTKRFIKQKNTLVALNSTSPKQKKLALLARKRAKLVLKSVKQCAGNVLFGQWLLETENG
ncbi:MAG: hypothetical protein KDD62_05835, partial [Bdellovibrionales bacterium]|nr:hypothetical protein [Bdellovibrionales bacterium]